jgi:hypothetical protein
MTNEPAVTIEEVSAENPDAIKQFLLVQQTCQNPATVVRFRAGMLLAREWLARFVEAESPSIAASIRANWMPQLGEDPGTPRRARFDEIVEADDMEAGPWRAKEISANVEARTEAAVLMFALGMTPTDELTPCAPANGGWLGPQLSDRAETAIVSSRSSSA